MTRIDPLRPRLFEPDRGRDVLAGPRRFHAQSVGQAVGGASPSVGRSVGAWLGSRVQAWCPNRQARTDSIIRRASTA